MLQLFSSSPMALSFGDSLVNWYEKSLIKELLDYFSEKYFSVHLGAYENFAVSPSLGVTLRNIILALAAAIIIAVCFTAYTRVNIGGFVRKLIAEGCLSPADAKNLYQLGYFRSSAIRHALSRSTTLGMVVRRVDVEGEVTDATTENVTTEAAEADEADTEATVPEPLTEAETDEPEVAAEGTSETLIEPEKATRIANTRAKIDFLTAKFYIPAELRDRAEIRFDPKGSGWKGAILISAITVVVAAVLCVLVPDLVQLADNIMTWLAP